MEGTVSFVGNGVDTLILNMRYSNSKGQLVKQELDEKLVQELDYLQGEARTVETAVATDSSPLDVQRQMGHTSLKMTNHYYSQTVEQLQRTQEMYSPLRVRKNEGEASGDGSGYWDE